MKYQIETSKASRFGSTVQIQNIHLTFNSKGVCVVELTDAQLALLQANSTVTITGQASEGQVMQDFDQEQVAEEVVVSSEGEEVGFDVTAYVERLEKMTKKALLKEAEALGVPDEDLKGKNKAEVLSYLIDLANI